MPARVFSQAPNDRIDLAALIRQAGRFFEASVEVLGQRERETPPGHEVRLRVTSARRGFAEEFVVRSREATADDWQAARRAEVSGRATGMSQLADRCRHVWDVQAASAPGSEAALLNLCALLAAVALGPVLPDDESTLFGIRGAMERLERLTGVSLAR